MTTQSVSAGNSAVNNISNSYQQRVTDEDPLGMDAFLTMLVAQLQNQDPLNPMEGTEFSTQLAQFSQLEQAMNTNDNLEKLIETMSEESETNLQDYLGKEVVAAVDSIEVDGGEPVGGYYTVEGSPTCGSPSTTPRGTRCAASTPARWRGAATPSSGTAGTRRASWCRTAATATT